MYLLSHWYSPYIFYSRLNTKSKLAIDRDILKYQFTMQIVFTDSNNIDVQKYIQNIWTFIKNNLSWKSVAFIFLLLPVLIKLFIHADVFVTI